MKFHSSTELKLMELLSAIENDDDEGGVSSAGSPG